MLLTHPGCSLCNSGWWSGCTLRISNIYQYLITDATKTFSAFVLSKLDYCNSLFYEVLQNILTNSKRSKILQPDSSSKFASMNTSNCSFKNFTGYQQPQESCTKVQLFFTIYYPSRQLHSISDTKAFCISFTKTKTYGQQAFSSMGPTQWNSRCLSLNQQLHFLSIKP